DQAPGVDPELDALVARCLLHDPSQRPGSAAEVEAALAAIGRRMDERALEEAPTEDRRKRGAPPSAEAAPAPPVGASPPADAPDDTQREHGDRNSDEFWNNVLVQPGAAATAPLPSFAIEPEAASAQLGSALAGSAPVEPVAPERWAPAETSSPEA